MEELDYKDLKYRLKEEGVGYAIKHYYGRNISHRDSKVVKLWAEAFDKISELESYIEERCDSGDSR